MARCCRAGWRTLAPQINRLYRLGRYALEVGLSGEDPVAWRRIGAPDLVQATENASSASVVVFCLPHRAGGLYVGAASRRGAPCLPTAALGMLAGALNGFLVCYYLVPLVFPTPRAIIAVQSGGYATLTGARRSALVAVSLARHPDRLRLAQCLWAGAGETTIALYRTP